MTAGGLPAWWNERRLGIFVHGTLATVPAWAPIGQYAEWYRAHLGEPVDDVILHPGPMPEVLAHHRDRWGHVATYDDFADLLHFDRFDAEAWAALADDAGAGYTVFVAKHHDGWAWWDAPSSTKRLTDVGPRRDVLAEYAAACERHDIVVGTYLSLLDWGDHRYPGEEYVRDVLHPQAIDLVERYGSAYLWGDGHWGHHADTWHTPELVDRLRAIDDGLLLNDRWHASTRDPESLPVVRTFEYQAPEEILEGPWELTRGIGWSFGHNRAEQESHHLTGAEIIDLHTEVVAKGGHLLLNVGPASDGTIPPEQAQPLRDAGRWIRRHAPLIGRSRPWEHWGDRSTRFTLDGDDLIAIDLDGRGRFELLRGAAGQVVSLELLTGADGESLPDPRWIQDDEGLHVELVGRRDPLDPCVYRIGLAPARDRITLFGLDEPGPLPLAPLLATATTGDIVQLGDGVYAGPAEVPPGVILRGLGSDRTTIVSTPATGIMPAPPAISLGRNARIEHASIEDRASTRRGFARSLVDAPEPFATVLACDVDGSITVTGDDVIIRASRARGVIATDVDRVLVSRCTLRGHRWDVGLLVQGGTDHEIESCTLLDHLCAIRFVDTTGSVARGNRVRARWWAVHARRTERAHVHGNRIESTMRAVDVEAGSGACVDGNAVTGGDSGCLVHQGATEVIVAGNHWQGSRAGLITWAADPLNRDNVCVDLLDPHAAHVTGP